MEAKKEMKKILMFPWLAYGHTSSFLEMAKRLSKFNFHIYICSSPINLQSIKPKLSDEYSSSIELIEIHLPSLPDLPPHFHTTNGLSSHLMPTLLKAFDMSAPAFTTILHNLKPDLLINDILQPWATQIASSLNIPVTYFITAGVITLCLALNSHNPEIPMPDVDLGHHWFFKKMMKSRASEEPDSGTNRLWETLVGLGHLSNTILANTCTELESDHIKYLSVLLNKKVLPTGLLVQKLSSIPIPNDGEKKPETLEWLDKKSPESTVYVSFGSECYLSKEDMEEVAHGLEQSGANFIWVVRFPKGEKKTMREELPEGFLERVGDRGMVIEGWAPQLRILEHSSVGGFVSHCGWNSMAEAAVIGVPIIALPMQLDQPWNGKIAEQGGIGVVAKRGEEGEIMREEIREAINEVLFEEKGEKMRKKVKEISAVLKKKEGEIIDGLVNELNLLCQANTEDHI